MIIPRSGKHQSAERKTSFHGKENTNPHKESSNPLMECSLCIIKLGTAPPYKSVGYTFIPSRIRSARRPRPMPAVLSHRYSPHKRPAHRDAAARRFISNSKTRTLNQVLIFFIIYESKLLHANSRYVLKFTDGCDIINILS